MELLEQLVAERDIRKIVALYPQYADDAKDKGWADLFTPDGEFVVGDRVVKGRAALAEWLLGTLKGPPMRHLMLNNDIEIVSEREARGSLDMALLLHKDGNWVVGPAPRYHDLYVRTEDGWKFARRTITMR